MYVCCMYCTVHVTVEESDVLYCTLLLRSQMCCTVHVTVEESDVLYCTCYC